jgi:serine/threonine protein kinase
MSQFLPETLKNLITDFFNGNKIPLTLEFYLIDFQKITDIFYFLKSVYIVFFRKINERFYEFVKYTVYELYGYKFVSIPQKNCLLFTYRQVDIYILFIENPDNMLSIRYEFLLKNVSIHQCANRQYTIIKLLTKGSYGKVYLCQDEHGNQFAMKFFQLKDEMDTELKALDHLETLDCVIKSLDRFYFNILGIEFGAFVMPFMKYTLKSLVEKENLSEDLLLRVFYSSLCDLRKIHEMGCLHMDVKPENILMELYADGSIDMKLADFGLAEILPEGTHYATTSDAKITWWFRDPMNALAEANKTQFHNSWNGDLFALCVSMIYMCSHTSGKKFEFLDSPIFNVFRGQQYLKFNGLGNNSPKEIDIEASTIRIENACRTAIKNPFFRNLLMKYMNPESILRWYSELQTSPKDNSVIPEVIAKIEVYFRMGIVFAELKEHFKKSESNAETPLRPRKCVSSP